MRETKVLSSEVGSFFLFFESDDTKCFRFTGSRKIVGFNQLSDLNPGRPSGKRKVYLSAKPSQLRIGRLSFLGFLLKVDLRIFSTRTYIVRTYYVAPHKGSFI